MKKIYSLIAVALAFGLASTVSAQLVHYSFNETSDSLVTDRSGNGNDAWANTDTSWVDGKIDGAMYFGGGNWVTIPAEDVALTSEEGTVAFWALIPESSSGSMGCMWWAGGADVNDMFNPHNVFHLHYEGTAGDVWAGGEVSYVVFDSIAETRYFLYSDPWDGGLGQAPSDQGILIADSTWHHVVATWQPGKLGLHIDGVTIWDTTEYYGNVWDMSYMAIGAQNAGSGSRNMIGYIDEFRLYDVALDIDGITEIYEFNGVEDMQQDFAFSVYPNPANDFTQVKFNDEGANNVSVNLYSVSGALINNLYTGETLAGDNRFDINTSALETGLYMLEIQIDNKVGYTKLVLE